MHANMCEYKSLISVPRWEAGASAMGTADGQVYWECCTPAVGEVNYTCGCGTSMAWCRLNMRTKRIYVCRNCSSRSLVSKPLLGAKTSLRRQTHWVSCADPQAAPRLQVQSTYSLANEECAPASTAMINC
jgi:hypothetical protein